MTLSLGQSLLKLPENSVYGATFPLEKPKPVPKTNDFSLSRCVHTVTVNKKRTNGKPLGFGAMGGEDH
jgi:hypothetical protein